MLWAMAVSEWSRAIAVAAFVGSYVGLALGRVPGFRIDRTGVAIIGAAVMVASGAVPWADVVASVDAPTLVLLFGMMIVTAYLRRQSDDPRQRREPDRRRGRSGGAGRDRISRVLQGWGSGDRDDL